MKKKKTRRSNRLRLGNVYSMDYNDHFVNIDWVPSASPSQLEPIVLRAVGTLVAITPTQYNLEYLSAPNAPTQDQRIVAIMRSCVTNVTDFGPANGGTK